MIGPVVVVLNFLILHQPDGTEIDINPNEIISLRRSPKTASELMVKGANCLVSLADGKNIAVQETCNEIRKQIELKP